MCRTPFRLVMTSLGMCDNADGPARHTDQTYTYLRQCGFNAIEYGYLDAWDRDLFVFDLFGRSNAIPNVVPEERKTRARRELAERLELAARHGLDVYLSTMSPISRPILEKSATGSGSGAVGNMDALGSLFGTGGDRYAAGRPTLCLGIAEVREHYRQLVADIVRSFPQIRGLTFFGGDAHSVVCEADCPRCGEIPAWKRYIEWVNELANVAWSINPQLRVFVRNWPWFDETFDMLEASDPRIGFILSGGWGVSMGLSGDVNPSLTTPWWCHDAQAHTMPVPDGEHQGTVAELSQPWLVTTEVSDKFRAFCRQAKASGRELVAWDERIVSETVMPFLIPTPLRTLAKLRSAAACGVDGIEEFFGVHMHEAEGRRVNVNTRVQSQWLLDPSLPDERILETVAEETYGPGTAGLALRAWQAMDEALKAWAILSWRQRMFWPVTSAGNSFYVRNLAVPLPPLLMPIQIEHGAREETFADQALWQGLHANLGRVLAGYDRSLEAYQAVIGIARDKSTAQFHHDCVALGRCFHVMARHTCLARIAQSQGQPVNTETMVEAVTNLKQIVALFDRLDVVRYDRDVYEEAVRSMLRQMAGNS